MFRRISLYCRQVIPVRVGAQYGDAEDKVHHDGAQHHARTQQDGPVLARPQSRHRLPLVQHVILAGLLVDGSEERRKNEEM